MSLRPAVSEVPLDRMTLQRFKASLAARAASTGAFVSVPDVREHEDLAKRVAALEGALGGSTSGFKSLQNTLSSHLQTYGEMVARVGHVEIMQNQLSADVKQLTEEVRSHERADLRIEQSISNMQSDVDRLTNKINRHERNESLHSHSDSRHDPKGFQENDAPARFMGAGRR